MFLTQCFPRLLRETRNHVFPLSLAKALGHLLPLLSREAPLKARPAELFWFFALYPSSTGIGIPLHQQFQLSVGEVALKLKPCG